MELSNEAIFFNVSPITNTIDLVSSVEISINLDSFVTFEINLNSIVKNG
jgi:hypothetical protein